MCSTISAHHDRQHARLLYVLLRAEEMVPANHWAIPLVSIAGGDRAHSASYLGSAQRGIYAQQCPTRIKVQCANISGLCAFSGLLFPLHATSLIDLGSAE